MVERLSWTSKHSQSLGHVSIVINIWSFQLHQESCRSPDIGVSKVPNRSGAPEENTSRHWQRATKTHPNHGCCELGFAGICCSGGSRAGSGWALGQPSPCHGPTGHGDTVPAACPQPQHWPGSGEAANTTAPGACQRARCSCWKICLCANCRRHWRLWSPSRERGGMGAGRTLYLSAVKIDFCFVSLLLLLFW